MTNGGRRVKRYITMLCAVFSPWLTVSAQTPSSADPETVVSSQALSAALADFAKQTGLQVVYVSNEVQYVKTLGSPRGLAPKDTLENLLRGTGLTFEYLNERTVRIYPRPVVGQKAAGAAPEAVAPTTPPAQKAAVNENSDNQGEKAMSHRSFLARAFGAFVTCGALVHAGAACAQDASTQGTAGGGLEEVVVTAEKFSENIEKTPLAITAITGEDLKSGGVFSATDLSGLIPNFTAAPNSNGSTVAIRGIVTTAQTLTGSPEVSYSEDGIALLQKIDAFQGMYDINRVEVLRGPQGTLYGADANAGAVNVITNKPDLTKMSATGSVSLGNYNAVSFQGAFNMPLTDTFGLRFAADQDYHSGYTTLLDNLGGKFNDEDFLGARIEALWKPTSDFSALFTYEQSHNGGAGDQGAGSGAPLGLYVAQTGAQPYAYEAMPSAPSQDWPISSATLTLNWSTPWMQIDLLSNVHWQDWFISQPETIYGPDASYCPNQTLPSECHDPGTNDDWDRQDSDELRFSNQNGPLHWLVGLYHVRDTTRLSTVNEPSTFNPALTSLQVYNYSEEQNAAFGQLSWNLTDQLALVGGLRYQRDVKNEPAGESYEITAPNGDIYRDGCIANCTNAASYSGYGSWSKVQWHAGVNYNLGPDSLLFASVATGFNTGAAPPLNPTYGPENLTDYELGWKAQLLDHRAQINIDTFYMTYSDYQVTTSLILPNGSYLADVVPAGSAVIKGVEFESTFLLTPADKVTFNATWLDAKFTSFYLPLGDGYTVIPHAPTNYTGNYLPYAPTTTEKLGYEHTFTLAGGDSLVAHADSNYSAHYYLDYHNYAPVGQDAYTRTDAWLAWKHMKESTLFQTQLYVRNIENKAILAGGQGDSAAPGHDFTQYGKNGYYLPPRTYGIQFSVSL
jgi:iron complex outermembrane recepter protein